MGLLWRTQTALSVFSCSGFGGVRPPIYMGECLFFQAFTWGNAGLSGLSGLGRSWGGLGRSWSGLGVILGHFWRLLGVKNVDFSFVFKGFREKS